MTKVGLSREKGVANKSKRESPEKNLDQSIRRRRDVEGLRAMVKVVV